jgi:Holliday junction resolvase RusA-like endonuclease
MESGELRPVKKPDMDNVLKVVADALNSVAYRDDTQIVDCQLRKFYDKQPRVEVIILTVNN